MKKNQLDTRDGIKLNVKNIEKDKLNHHSNCDQYRRNYINDHVESHKRDQFRNVVMILVRADKRGYRQSQGDQSQQSRNRE